MIIKKIEINTKINANNKTDIKIFPFKIKNNPKNNKKLKKKKLKKLLINI